MTTDERFWKYVNPEPNTGCFLWGGALLKNGYGSFMMSSEKGWRMKYAHRIAWELNYGQVPNGMDVCHKCDVRSCVNPDHLFLGTRGDNMRDAQVKGRTARGERQGHTNLTEVQVGEILRAEGTQAEIASRFGISRASVSDIRRGARWKYITDERPGPMCHRPVKLNHELAEAIRADVGSQSAIAAKYGVSQATVSYIRTGKIWKAEV